jgi:glycosyltransferase involved in cell wall biosynthesis
MKKINVQIVQPVIPHYRVDLFKKIVSNRHLSVSIQASPFFNGMYSSDKASFVDLNHKCISFLRSSLFWQAGLKLDPSLSSGDVLIVNGNIRVLSNFPLIFFAKLKKISVINWNHGYSATSSQLGSKIRRFIMKIADYHLLYTEAEVSDYLNMGYDKEKCFYANNTLCLNEIDVAIKNNSKKVDLFKLKNDLHSKKILLFCGRLRKNPSTDLPLLLLTLKNLININDDYRLVIIGDGESKAELMQYANKLLIHNYIIWVGAQYNEEYIAPWFLSADCFVYPGSIGLGLMHAFSYGLPVITHDVIDGHGPEIAALEENLNGLFFKRYNEKSLLNSIIKYFSKDNTLMKMEAYRTVRDRHSFDEMLSRVLSIIFTSSKKNR